MHKSKNAARFFPLFLVLYEMSIYLSNDAYLPAVPTMGSALHTADSWLPFTVTLWFVGSFVTQLLMGPICDRIGRRRTLLLGSLMYVFSSIFCSLADSLLPFLIGRFLQGASMGSMTVAGYATIHDSFEQKQAIKTIAWMGAVSIIAPAVGPLIGSGLLIFGSWRFIFLLLAGLAAIALVGNFFCMPETSVRGQNKTPALVSYKRILGSWKYMGQALSLACSISIIIARISASPWIIDRQFGLPGYYFGIFQAINCSGFIIGTRLVNWLIERFGIPTVVDVCMKISLLAACLSLFFTYFLPNNLTLFVAYLTVISASLGVCFPIINRMAIESSGESMETRVAMFATVISIGAALGSAAIGILPNINTMALSVLTFLGTGAAILLHRSTQK